MKREAALGMRPLLDFENESLKIFNPHSYGLKRPFSIYYYHQGNDCFSVADQDNFF